jgi:hypothetical protein
LAIATIIDALSVEGRLAPTAIDEVIAALGFLMSRPDSEFLVNYIHWRTDNPKAS